MFIIEALVALTFWGIILVAASVISLLGAVTTFKRNGGATAIWIFAALVCFGLAFFQPLSGWAKSYVVATDPFALNWSVLLKDIVVFVAVWMLAGAVTSYFYWLSKTNDIAKLYSERKTIASELVKLLANKRTEMMPEHVPSSTLLAAITKAVALGGISHRSVGSYHGVTYPHDLEGNVFEDRSFRFAGSNTHFDHDGVLVSPGSSVWQEDSAADLHAAVTKVLPPRILQHKADVSGAAFVWPVTLLSLVFADLLRHFFDWVLKFWHRLFDFSAERVFDAHGGV